MDAKYLEFWGNFLIAVAKNKEMADKFFNFAQTGKKDSPNKAMNEAFKGFNELYELFRKIYGLDKLPSQTGYEKISDKALQDFQKSFNEALLLFGFVSKERYFALVKKYEALKEKLKDRDETIEHLKMLLNERGGREKESGQQEAFQNIMETQGALFSEMVKELGKIFTPSGENSPEENKKGDRQR